MFTRCSPDFVDEIINYSRIISDLIIKDRFYKPSDLIEKAGISVTKAKRRIGWLMNFFSVRKSNILAIVLWCKVAPWTILPDRPGPSDTGSEAWKWLMGQGLTTDMADLVIGRLYLRDNGKIRKWLEMTNDKFNETLNSFPEKTRFDSLEMAVLALFEHLGQAVPRDEPLSGEQAVSKMNEIKFRLPKELPKRHIKRRIGRPLGSNNKRS